MQKRRLRMQVRATPEDGEGTFVSQVSAYNTPYDIGWGFKEKILPGCFADSIEAHGNILPIFYEHAWDAAPIGDGKPTEHKDSLTVKGELYLGVDGWVDRVYRGMKAGTLSEWSIAFWPETIVTDSEEPMVDQIARGDLAEASVCVRGANPDTGTIDLRTRGYLMDGTEAERQAYVASRALHQQVPDLEPEPEVSQALLARAWATDDGWDLIRRIRSSRA